MIRRKSQSGAALGCPEAPVVSKYTCCSCGDHVSLHMSGVKRAFFRNICTIINFTGPGHAQMLHMY